MNLTLICFIVFLVFAAAVFLISGLDEIITLSLKRMWLKKTKSKALRVQKGTLLKKLSKLNRKRRTLIVAAQMPISTYYLLTVFGAISGTVIGKVFFQEALFGILVAILGALSPILYLNIKQTAAKSTRIEKLQSSMMILSSSYLVTEDFVRSVQDNIALLEHPVPFKNFLSYVSCIDGNVKTALRRLENQVDNYYFSQWIDVLVMAQDDRSLKYVTMSVMDEMNDMQQIQLEADTAIFAVWREYLTVLVLIFSSPLIFRVLMGSAYEILVTSVIGKGLLLLLLVCVVYSVIKAVRLNKPLLM